DEESSGSSPSSPQIVARRGKFDDEEEDGDVLDSWDAAEDSEVEREKAKKAAEAKAKAEEEAKKNHKSKSQRIEERRQENMRKRMEDLDFDSDDDEDEAERKARLRREQKESDLKHAEDLFEGIGVPATRSNPKAITVADEKQPGNAIDLSAMPLFNPTTKDQFAKLREILAPLLVSNVKKAQYTIFMQEFAKDIVKELPSDQIKKIASGLTTLSNEKMREEKKPQREARSPKPQRPRPLLQVPETLRLTQLPTMTVSMSKLIEMPYKCMAKY
ncbi:unnamed protein product, partial [Aureobasidium vineae]